MGILNVVAVSVCMVLLHYHGRRTLMLWGFFMMAVSLLGLGVFSLVSMPYLAITSILIYRISFELSAGPLMWLYNAEILHDKALGLASGSHWFLVLLISTTVPSIVAQLGKDQIGYIWIFCGICTGIGYILLYIYMHETKGKTK